MFVLRRLEQLQECLDAYDDSGAFRQHLRQWFRQNRQMGSKDRKELTALAYGWFRLGRLTVHGDDLKPWLAPLFLPKKFNYTEALIADGKLPSLDPNTDTWQQFLDHFDLQESDKFPEFAAISDSIDKDKLLRSMRTQQAAWFRIKSGKQEKFLNLLKSKDLAFEQVGRSIHTGEVDLTREFGDKLFAYGEIQDLSSTQSTIGLDLQAGELVWDCCAASGGKSLALVDAYPGVRLIASDIRPQMLRNFIQRFQQSGEGIPKFFACDLTKLEKLPAEIEQSLPEGTRLTVFLDAPCSGSGTWGRQPENLVKEQGKRSDRYAELQSEILAQVVPLLRTGDQLVYVTCSVYAKENEGHDDQIEGLGMERISQEYFQDSDFLFRSVWVKG